VIDTVSILGTPGFVREPSRFDTEKLLKVLGENSGNLMFQYAATELIGANKKNIGRSEIDYTDPNALDGAEVLVLPAANHLRLNADWTGLLNFLEKSNLPLVVLGLGAQSPKIGGEQDTIKALKADLHVSRLASIIRERAKLVTVRGAYSQAVCAELGMPDVLVLGCPSALLNPDPNAGKVIEEKLEALKSRQDVPLLALTAAAPFEIHRNTEKLIAERKLFTWLRQRGGLYVQQSGGPQAASAVGAAWRNVSEKHRNSIQWVLQPDTEPEMFWSFMERKGRFYTSAPTWIEEMATVELSLGTRLHGNMAAIAASTPGIVIAHDSRTSDLIDTMKLPNTSIEHVTESNGVNEIIKSVHFDGTEFDRWRSETAQNLYRAFAHVGIHGSEHLRNLALSCPRKTEPHCA